ncbi:AbrB/MazE/SpoVT family DNA-binding domain-containing protein [Desulfotruncus arcticus]|uniref:AbrB/MazE/SpoVT family DNA-binding domain-containing protein n=1 Tax=Desulfotruncus arcticus TaxID=341036 RepID=UPI000B86C63A|nr:AbrB/MazE/SpoVT family DNA-binding domain-containing protein [Desulfotruncus arcticus]
MKSKKVRVWGKGQPTIPVGIRERLDIKEDSYLEVFQVGKIIAIPERLIVKELANSFPHMFDVGEEFLNKLYSHDFYY